jgi:hypothetical protein
MYLFGRARMCNTFFFIKKNSFCAAPQKYCCCCYCVDCWLSLVFYSYACGEKKVMKWSFAWMVVAIVLVAVLVMVRLLEPPQDPMRATQAQACSLEDLSHSICVLVSPTVRNADVGQCIYRVLHKARCPGRVFVRVLEPAQLPAMQKAAAAYTRAAADRGTEAQWLVNVAGFTTFTHAATLTGARYALMVETDFSPLPGWDDLCIQQWQKIQTVGDALLTMPLYPEQPWTNIALQPPACFHPTTGEPTTMVCAPPNAEPQQQQTWSEQFLFGPMAFVSNYCHQKLCGWQFYAPGCHVANVVS